MSPVEERLRRFLESQFLFEFDDVVTGASNLFALGLIDSFGFVELVAFMEREFAIKLSDEELTGGSLNTLAGLVATVARKSHG